MAQIAKLPVIGSTTTIDLPDVGLFGIPAKVDTGADSSSIWASSIQENSGKLTYCLFAKGSPHYTGQKFSSGIYKVIIIKNSFGTVERRYKIRLIAKISGKKVTVNFTLADRSLNKFPILIGKATLRNKFIVDVATRPPKQKKGVKKVLILASSISDSASLIHSTLNSQFANNFTTTLSTYLDLEFKFMAGQTLVIDHRSGQEISTFDLVYFRTYLRYPEQAAAVAEYLNSLNIPFLDQEVGTYHTRSKLTQYMKLYLNNLPLPDSIFLSGQNLKTGFSYIAEQLGKPFVLKGIESERGENNYLVSSPTQFEKIVSSSPDVQFIAQKFIESDDDLRVLGLKNKIVLIMRRTANSTKTHLHNTSKGAKADLLPLNYLDISTKAICKKTMQVLNRQIAGIDIIFDEKQRKWYILEVNKSPQISSGKYTDEKMTAFGTFLADYLNRN